MLESDTNQITEVKTGQEKRKIKLFICTDGPTVQTGFGRVCYELVTRWLATGKYQIIVMATNDRGSYHPLRGVKDLIIEPLPYIAEDPYGFQRLPELLQKYKPDLLFALNDVWVWTADERRPQMLNWFTKHLKSYKPYVPFVGYFPVDGRPWAPMWKDMINNMTFAVAYTDYGVDVLKNTPGVDMRKVRRIYHGSGHDHFYPVDKEETKNIKQAMQISEDTFLIGVVNRNQPRKQIPRLVQAFKMFHDGYVKCAVCGFPRSLDLHNDCELCGCTAYYEKIDGHKDTALYLHMNVADMRGYKLAKVIADNKAENVITRPDHDVAVGVSIEELNKLYNTFDVHVSTTSAGGYELSTPESQSAGTPNITTRTTSLTELMDNECGYLSLPTTHVILDDANHCYKHLIDLQGLLDSLETAYQDWLNKSDRRKRIIKNATISAHIKTWDLAANEFDKLFDEALKTRVCLHEIVDSPDKQTVSFVFVHETDDMSKVLAALPALEKVSNSHPGKTIVALKERFLPLIDLPRVEAIPIEYMWIDDQELKEKRVSVQPISHLIDKYESGAIGTPDKSWAEVFCRSCSMPYDDLNINYQITDQEKEWARKILGYDVDESNGAYRVLSIIDVSNPNSSLLFESWKQINQFIGRLNNVLRITISDQYLSDELSADIKLHSLTMREIFALISQVNCVILSDENYIYVPNIFKDTRFIFVQGPRDNTFNIFNDNVIFISEKMKYRCMPCWKKPNMQCRVSGNIRSNCIDTIIPGEIFSKVLRLKKDFESSKTK